MRIEPLLESTLLVADRGAGGHTTENSVDAFRLALRLGATAVQSAAWVTSDDVVVLHRTGLLAGQFRKRRISGLSSAELPDDIPTLKAVLDEIGSTTPVSLSIGSDATVAAVVDVVRRADSSSSLWLRHGELETLTDWRAEFPDAQLINLVTARTLRGGLERRGSELRDRGIEGLALHRSEWSGGYTTMLHRFGRTCWAEDVQHEREARALLKMGVDALVTDHISRIVDAIDS